MMRLRNSIFVFFMPVAALILAIFIPVLSKTRAIAKRVICQDYIQNLSIAMEVYKIDFHGQYPVSGQWCDLLIKETEMSPKYFKCPLDLDNSFSYAINENFNTVEPNEVLPQMVMLFEADLGCNGIGGPDDLVFRHEQNGRLGCNIVYADRHVEFVTEDEIGDLKWTVE